MRAFITAFCLVLATSAAQAGHRYRVSDYGEVVAHPAGCPWSLFCGCGAAEHILGHFVPQSSGLWLTTTWYRYPHLRNCERGAGAVWPGHVAAIESCEGNGIAILYDANSGGHLTRIHRASLAGATIVRIR